MHMDGARLMNAVVATGTSAKQYAAPFDTVMCCLSKGLGAPIGSLLLGRAEHIRLAHRYRKALGGGMRQAGVLAAPALLALHEGPDQLARDHANATRLAEGLAAIEGVTADPAGCQTNILFIKTEAGPARDARLCTELAARDILAIPLGALGVRFVTHRHIETGDVDRCLAAVRAAMAS
jgi:threonine aldolase